MKSCSKPKRYSYFCHAHTHSHIYTYMKREKNINKQKLKNLVCTGMKILPKRDRSQNFTKWVRFVTQEHFQGYHQPSQDLEIR